MRESNRKRLSRGSCAAVIALVVALAAACGGRETGKRDGAATADARLRAAIAADGLAAHLRAFQRFADSGDGSRAEGSAGFRASVEYVQEQLRPTGYRVTVQPFAFKAWRELRPTLFELVEPAARRFDSSDFSILPGSRAADVTAQIQPTTDVVLAPAERDTSTSGCEPEDFTGFIPGNFALVQRGTCDFRRKIENAEAAGASAVVIFNEGHPEGRDLTRFQFEAIGRPVLPPVLFVSYDLGADLYRAATSARPLRAHIATRTGIANVESVNVIAASPHGRHDRTIVVGAHLDSILLGPGLNDNGSGSAALLEIARKLSTITPRPQNRVIFAWWGGEESGLKGSEHFLSELSRTELKGILAYLNLDMLGSRNFGRLVDDGDGSATFRPGPAGSAAIERAFLDYFEARGLRVSAPAVGRETSDTKGFADREISVGGLQTGHAEPKPAWQVELFGGRPDAAYDPCYHEPCDRYPDNVNMRVLEQMADAAAHVVRRLATRGLPAS